MKKPIRVPTIVDVESTIKKFMTLDPESKNYALGYMEAMLQASERSKATRTA